MDEWEDQAMSSVPGGLQQGPPTDKAFFPWVARIKQPILDIMQLYIPAGSQGMKFLTLKEHGGELAGFLATAYPGAQFQPTAAAPELVRSINAHCEGLPNVQPGRHLDPAQDDWSMTDKMDAIIATHLAQSLPWEATLGLMAGSSEWRGRRMVPGGRLFLYGPFLKEEQYMTDNDLAYDTFLRNRNPEWGYRDIAEVVAAAQAQGLRQRATHNMPANNFMLVFEKVAWPW